MLLFFIPYTVAVFSLCWFVIINIIIDIKYDILRENKKLKKGNTFKFFKSFFLLFILSLIPILNVIFAGVLLNQCENIKDIIMQKLLAEKRLE